MGRKKTSVQILTSDRTGFKTKILCWLKRNNQILLKRKTTASGCFWHTYFKLIRQRKINECVHLDTTFSFFTSCHWPPKLSASLVPLYFSAEHAVPCDMPSRAFHRVVIVTSTRTEVAGALHEGGVLTVLPLYLWAWNSVQQITGPEYLLKTLKRKWTQQHDEIEAPCV